VVLNLFLVLFVLNGTTTVTLTLELQMSVITVAFLAMLLDSARSARLHCDAVTKVGERMRDVSYSRQ